MRILQEIMRVRLMVHVQNNANTYDVWIIIHLNILFITLQITKLRFIFMHVSYKEQIVFIISLQDRIKEY